MGAGLGAGEKAGKVTQKDEREQEWVGEEQEEGGDGLRAGGPESRPCGGGVLTAKVALHPPPVSIKLLISILTTQLIRLHVLNYDIVHWWGRGSAVSPHPQAPQEPRFIDQKRHTKRPRPLAVGLGGVSRGVREAGKRPSALGGGAPTSSAQFPPGLHG